MKAVISRKSRTRIHRDMGDEQKEGGREAEVTVNLAL